MASEIFIGPSHSQPFVIVRTSTAPPPHALQGRDFRIKGALSIYFGHLGGTQGVLSTAQPARCPEIIFQQALNTTGYRKKNILSRDEQEGKEGLFKEALWSFQWALIPFKE